jgi:hypothetical protein
MLADHRTVTASCSNAQINASVDMNIPNYVCAIVTAVEIVDSISSL